MAARARKRSADGSNVKEYQQVPCWSVLFFSLWANYCISYSSTTVVVGRVADPDPVGLE